MDEERPRSTLRTRSRRRPYLALALAVVVAAIAAYMVFRTPDVPPPPPPAPTPSAAPAEATPSPAAGEPIRPAKAEEMRGLLEGVSANALFRRALEGADLPRRWALVTDALAHGDTPRKPLAILAPGAPFSVSDQGGRTVIAAASYARYDAFAGAVASVDAAKLVRAYRALHGVLEAAYRALGYPEANLDTVSARALARVAAVHVPDGDVEVRSQPDRGNYAFADPKLEDASELDKHLLRMGARNARLVQAKARELARALGPAPSAEPAPAR